MREERFNGIVQDDTGRFYHYETMCDCLDECKQTQYWKMNDQQIDYLEVSRINTEDKTFDLITQADIADNDLWNAVELDINDKASKLGEE